jgi:uncharacterized LabA/DUF88 family protein
VRLAMFVDGWNMYWSLVGAKIRPYGWCDFRRLALQTTGYSEAVVAVKFFTSEDLPHREKIDKQQRIWSLALEFTGCEIIWGEFRSTHVEVEEQIRNDEKRWREKQTDIALASHMIADCNRIEAIQGRAGEYRWNPGYDEAILLTQDSDFIPAVEIVANKPFNRRVRVLLPPSEFIAQQNAARIWEPLSRHPMVSVRQLSKDDFARALLPKVIDGPHGEKVTCDRNWMWREKYESEIADKPGTVAELEAKFPRKPQVAKRPAPR